MIRKTKIVATIGPASRQLDILKKMVAAGMNVARLNFSHGDHKTHAENIELIRQASADTCVPVAILLDSKGPEIRIRTFAGGQSDLIAGEKFVLTTRDVTGNGSMVSVNHPGFPGDVKKGCPVLIDDGMVELKVEEITETDVMCKVVNGGILTDRKSVNIPGCQVSMPSLSEEDRDDIIFGIEKEVDFVAASFVRMPEDILAIRRLMEENGASIPIIAKIENQQGLDNLDAILRVSDGLMVARGDLGVEIPPEEVPLAQKHMITRCNQLGKPVITATQMLDSMIRNPRPTRAEASDVANAIFDGTDAIMLSGETAAGRYPVEAVETMARMALRTEQALDCQQFLARHSESSFNTVTDSISYASRQTAQRLGASAILTSTQSGHTARMVSKYRPPAPVVAITPSMKVVRQLLLCWGVVPLQGRKTDNTDQMIYEAISTALDKGDYCQGRPGGHYRRRSGGRSWHHQPA
jgi:pyruvate kinase